jgi:hypothetical protein
MMIWDNASTTQAHVAAPLTVAAGRFERPCTVRAGKGQEHAGAAATVVTPRRRQEHVGRWGGERRRYGPRTKNHAVVLPGTRRERDTGRSPAATGRQDPADVLVV